MAKDNSKDKKANDRQKALDTAISQIHKQFGKGSIMKLGESPRSVSSNVIPTGSLTLDAALGIGGFPRGRLIEVFGPEASGKTTIALQAVANAQKAGGQAAFIDTEHALDPIYARALGINLDELLLSQPDAGEQALEIAEILTRSGGIDIFVLDSVAALVPRAEIEGEMGDAHVGLQARLMSQALRKLTSVISRSNTCAVFTNQIRMKIGVMWGNPETTPGGLALKFHSSIRLDIRRIAAIKKGDEVLGNRTRIKVVKNKLAPPFKIAEFDILYGKGVSYLGELVDKGVDLGMVQKSGTWYSLDDERMGQGRDAAIAFLEENEDAREKLETQVRGELFGTKEPEARPAEEPAEKDE
ncbi:recombinase RecA [candidate division WOR-3 bacterium]|uniref:Protein RecA n=1 Tax=candidate division WOR-3 bacterium TaxID=2052148 RepID=A0A9D5K833_UNCW3|nr:recombinase RecA [candidate division WOR-3 bacterium]MBD3364012.1 recombinase RecA [candidate division WOR-3 bacterium]